MVANKEDTRLASSVNKDGDDAITSIHSGNNGNEMLQKHKSKAVVQSIFGYKPNSNGKPMDEVRLFVRFVMARWQHN